MGLRSKAASAAFSKVFGSSRTASKSVSPQLGAMVGAVASAGGKRIFEFMVAIPVFMCFIRELLANRDRVDARKRLIIVGSAAAMSTLGLTFVVFFITSLPFQIAFTFSNPVLGFLLFFSGGIIIPAIIVSLVWLIIYVLNCAMEGDPVFQEVKQRLLPADVGDLIRSLSDDIERSGVNLTDLRTVVEERIVAKGSESDAGLAEKDLAKLEEKLKGKWSHRLKRLADTA